MYPGAGGFYQFNDSSVGGASAGSPGSFTGWSGYGSGGAGLQVWPDVAASSSSTMPTVVAPPLGTMTPGAASLLSAALAAATAASGVGGVVGGADQGQFSGAMPGLFGPMVGGTVPALVDGLLPPPVSLAQQQQQLVQQQRQLQQLQLMHQQAVVTTGGSVSAPQDRVDRLFISKLSSELNREDLRDYFSQFGELTDVYLPLAPGTTAHKGICFVSFANPMDLHRAISFKPHEIRGIPMSVDVAAPRAAPPTSVSQSVTNGARLFLTKVTPEVNRNDILAYFAQFGDVTDCYVPPGNKGIAFVSFAAPQMAQKVLQNATHQVKPGQTIVVSQAFDRPTPGKGGGKGGCGSPLAPALGGGLQFAGGCAAGLTGGAGCFGGLGGVPGAASGAPNLAALTAALAGASGAGFGGAAAGGCGGLGGLGLDLGTLQQVLQLQQLLQQQQQQQQQLQQLTMTRRCRMRRPSAANRRRGLRKAQLAIRTHVAISAASMREGSGVKMLIDAGAATCACGDASWRSRVD
mmetsp:Transcript_1236/g.3595  ORF Transcript_1236/g.3595 Transcript_1236/m.3595 type:complete len:519 (+) Transcript_1236:1584-3140(+)